MTNDEIRLRIERLNEGGELTLDEQLQTLRALLRANKKILAAKRQGFDPDEIGSHLESDA